MTLLSGEVLPFWDALHKRMRGSEKKKLTFLRCTATDTKQSFAGIRLNDAQVCALPSPHLLPA